VTLLRLVGLFIAIIVGWSLAGVLLFVPANWVRKRYGYLATDAGDPFDSLLTHPVGSGDTPP
jgi:hypothetical protein